MCPHSRRISFRRNYLCNTWRYKPEAADVEVFLIVPYFHEQMRPTIQSAAEQGDTNTVKKLLCDTSVNPAAQNNYAIRCAARLGFSVY